MRLNWLVSIALATLNAAATARAGLFDAYSFKPLKIDASQFSPPPAFDRQLKIDNGAFEQGGKGWHLPAGTKVVQKISHNATAALEYVRTNPKDKGRITQAIDLQPGGQYRFSAYLKTQDVHHGWADATIAVLYYGPHGYLGKVRPDGMTGTRKWTRLSGQITVPPGVTRCELALGLGPGTTGTVWFDDVTVQMVDPLWSCRIIRPYRPILPADDGRMILSSWRRGNFAAPTVNVDADQLACLVRVMAGDKVLSQRVTAVDKGRVAVDVGQLPPGEYTLDMQLLDVTRRWTLAHTDTPLRVVASADYHPAPIDDHGRLLVDGQPFFPIGVYCDWPLIKPSHKWPWEVPVADLDQLAKAGFNCILPYHVSGMRMKGTQKRGLDALREFLDACNARGLKVMFDLSDLYAKADLPSSSQWGYTHWLKGEKDWHAAVKRVVDGVKDHPAIIAWYLNDEQSVKYTKVIAAMRTEVNRLDPSRITMGVHFQYDELPRYAGWYGWLGIDPYPIWTKADRSMRMIPHALEMANRSVSAPGCTPFWVVPQQTNLGIYYAGTEKRFREHYRFPTAREMKAFAVISMANGANGIVYFSYFDLFRDWTKADFDKNWAQLAETGRFLKEITPTVLLRRGGPKLREIKKTGKAGAATLLDAQGRPLVLLWAEGPGKAQLTFRLPSNVLLHSTSGRTTRLADGQYQFNGVDVDYDVLVAKEHQLP
jgi:hypothetical protein